MTKYKVHTFLSSNNFTVSSISNNPVYDTIEYLVVAGGGPGTGSTTGGRSGGGGGAGGLILANVTLIDTNGLFVVVGGAGSNSTIFANSTPSFTAINAVRGGAGGIRAAGGTGGNGKPGGSGGGGSSQDIGDAAVLAGGLQWGQQGNEGGWAFSGPSGAGAGGGGGYSSRGSNSSGLVGGAGGFGANVNITGIFTVYSQGGNGGNATSSSPGINGSVNTGQGGSGGGGAAFTDDTLGGSGIVIIRYPVVPEIQPKISRVANISSNLSSVTTGDIVEFTITTANAANGEVLYYSTNNQPSAAFTEGNTGSFIVNGNVGTVTLSITANGLDEEFFDLQVRRNSSSGPLLRQGGNVFIDIPTYLEATGGDVLEENGYKIHIFTTSGDFDVSYTPENSSNLEIILIGGGGGGGSASVLTGPLAGGGGAGGVFMGNVLNVSPGPYTILIGGGGARGNTYNANPGGWRGPGGNGGNTTAFGYTALGGGGGGAYTNSSPPVNGKSGGSGGGGGGVPGPDGGSRPGGGGITWDGVIQGYPGGNGMNPPGGANPSWVGGGGGGGAGEAGQNAGTPSAFDFDAPQRNLNNRGGKGGNGIAVLWFSNVNYGTPGFGEGRWFAGGGGGSLSGSSTFVATGREVWLPVGGMGGGGSGTNLTDNPSAPYGSIAPWYRAEDTGRGNINTGGGGGAGGFLGTETSAIAGSGGSGIVIIRYPYQ